MNTTKSYVKEHEKRCDNAKAALAAMKRIAPQILGQFDGQSTMLRGLLLSLYNGHKVRLNDVCGLNSNLREDLALIVIGINTDICADFHIRQAFIAAGDADAEWFLSGLDLKTKRAKK